MSDHTQAIGSPSERLQIQWVPLESVQLNPENPRLNEPAVEPVMRSIARFGFRVPIVVNRRTNLIEAGNTRWKAAQRMGLTEVPVIFADDDEVTALAFALADNRTAEIAQWDEPALAGLLRRLEAEDELTSSGFSDDDLGSLLARLDAQEKSGREETFNAEAAMGEAEQQTGPTRVQPGEMWQLGRHRLLCGDAIDPANWERLMVGEVAQAIITDPPYGINYLGGRAAQQERIAAKRRGAEGQEADAHWDDLTDDEYRHLLTSSLGLAHQHSDGKAPALPVVCEFALARCTGLSGRDRLAGTEPPGVGEEQRGRRALRPVQALVRTVLLCLQAGPGPALAWADQ